MEKRQVMRSAYEFKKFLFSFRFSRAWTVGCGLLMGLLLWESLPSASSDLRAANLDATPSLSSLRTSMPETAPPALTQGYVPRACGFDLDDDGVLGEAEDCRVCNASVANGRIEGGDLDPDADGIQEDLIYIDCDGGRDTRGCGLQGRPPCKTIQFALNQMDGPADGAEDIACFRGTCSGEGWLTPKAGGLRKYHRVAASGSQVRDFEFPSDPAMIVGWDSDGDHRYPPFDSDDVSIMEAGRQSQAFALNRDGVDHSFFEMAHFEARNYGRFDDQKKGGFLKLSQGQPASHLYVHDLVLKNINRDRPSTSGRITFNFFSLGSFRYAAFVNLLAADNGGYLNRGAAPYVSPGAGPIRWQNITVSAHSCDESGPEACAGGAADAYWTGWKLWGFFEGIEILDSVVEANLAAWKPKRRGGPVGVQGVVAAECSVDWMIRNNVFRDTKTAFRVQNYAEGFCDGPLSRPVAGVVFDQNLVLNQEDWWENGLIAVATGPGGGHQRESNGSITISRNRIISEVGWDTAIDLQTGNGGGTSPGSISVLGNSIFGLMRTDDSAFLRVASPHPFKQHEAGIILRGNRFCGVGEGKQNLRTMFSVDNWQASGNSYDSDGHFAWAGKRTADLAGFRELTKQDIDSRTIDCSDVLGEEFLKSE